MKLCIVTQQLVRGHGQGRVNYEIAQEALRQGHHITLLATSVAPELLEHREQVNWVPIKVLAKVPQLINDWLFAWHTTRWLNQNRNDLDIIAVNGGITWAPATVNIVHFVHSAWLASPFHVSRLQKGFYGFYQRFYSVLHSRWERRVCAQVDRIIAVSKKVGQELETIGVTPEKIDVIINGVELEKFSPGSANRSAWGLPEVGTLAFFAGDISNSRKNLDTVLRAMCQVSDLSLVVLGSTEKSPYPLLADQLGIAERVYFLGYRKDIPELMRAADLLVFPSRYEACTLVLLEAMASGLPIITATSTGGAELVTPDAGIVLSDPNDVAALAAALTHLTQDAELRYRMGQAGRAIAQKHSWSNMARHYIALFEELNRSTHSCQETPMSIPNSSTPSPSAQLSSLADSDSTIPKVAVCIPTYNQANYLKDAVESACCQTYPHVQVWVADDCSTDDTPEVMEQLVQKYRQLHYHLQPKNLGIADNNNWLLRQPDDVEFIVRLDSDDFLSPNYVETLVALMLQYPSAGYAHAAVQEIDSNGIATRERRVARANAFQDSDVALKASVSGYRVAANICLFRAVALRELNFYEGRPDYTEDYDLSVRMADAGYGNVYSSKILSSYRVWTDTKKTRPRRKALEVGGLIRIFDESLIPAFRKRNWSLHPILQNRRRLALVHAASCHAPWFSETEKADLIILLQKLGDSPALRVRLFALRFGLAPLFQWWQKTNLRLRGVVKTWLSKNEFNVGSAMRE